MVVQFHSRGFTLIELLVVMTILGLLLSLSVPRYFGNVEKARESVLRQDLAQMRNAIDNYFADVGRYPESLNELVERKYIRRIPTDPITDKADTWISIAPATENTGNVFDVRSGSHERARDGSDYAGW